ncbi:MAG: hypothetical protein U0031_02180 [Thermomicrobiales bacterium]
MGKWAVLMAGVILVAGVAFMFAWSAINHLLAGQGSAIDWQRTVVSVIVVLLSIGVFIRFSNAFAETEH